MDPISDIPIDSGPYRRTNANDIQPLKQEFSFALAVLKPHIKMLDLTRKLGTPPSRYEGRGLGDFCYSVEIINKESGNRFQLEQLFLEGEALDLTLSATAENTASFQQAYEEIVEALELNPEKDFEWRSEFLETKENSEMPRPQMNEERTAQLEKLNHTLRGITEEAKSFNKNFHTNQPDEINAAAPREQQITNRLATSLAALTAAGLAALFLYAAKVDQERAAEQTNESVPLEKTNPPAP